MNIQCSVPSRITAVLNQIQRQQLQLQPQRPQQCHVQQNPHFIYSVVDGQRVSDMNISSGLLNVNGGATASHIIVSGDGTGKVTGKADNITIKEKGSFVITSGGEVNDVLLENGFLRVQKGGKLNNSIINNGSVKVGPSYYRMANRNNEERAVLNNTVINGGCIELQDDGYAYNNRIVGGRLVVEKTNAGAKFNTVEGGALEVRGGRSENNNISAGLFNLSDGASAKITIVNNGGKFIISGKGSRADSNIINAGGRVEINNEGHAESNIISGNYNDGAELKVVSNGSVKETIVNKNGRLELLDGAYATLTQVQDGGYVSVADYQHRSPFNRMIGDWIYGTDKDTIIDQTSVFSGGLVDVDNGSRAQNTVVHDGGALRLRTTYWAGGQAVNTTVEHGGCLVIEQGASAVNTTVAGVFYPKIDGEAPKDSYECV